MERFMEKQTLDELSQFHGTDKSSKNHNYAKYYDAHFSEHRDEPIRFLEIGVWRGASLNTWREYFSTALIVGTDISQTCQLYDNEEENLRVEIGDQLDKGFMEGVWKKYGYFDIVVDDGGHTWKQQIETFNHLFPKMKSGSLYAIEDLHTSYSRGEIRDTGKRYDDYEYNCVEFIYKKIGELMKSKNRNLKDSDVEEIHVYQSMVIFKRR